VRKKRVVGFLRDWEERARNKRVGESREVTENENHEGTALTSENREIGGAPHPANEQSLQRRGRQGRKTERGKRKAKHGKAGTEKLGGDRPSKKLWDNRCAEKMKAEENNQKKKEDRQNPVSR